MLKPPPFACQFEFTPDNAAVVISLVGKMGPEAVEDLYPQVQEVFRAGLRRFVFDLSDLEYVGSLGLRLFLGLQNQVKGQGRVVLCCPSDAVRSMLDMSKLNQVFALHQSRAEALEATGK